jgi:hypothetical protein
MLTRSQHTLLLKFKPLSFWRCCKAVPAIRWSRSPLHPISPSDKNLEIQPKSLYIAGTILGNAAAG